MKELPIQCQFAPLFGMLTGDFNNDGHLDIVMTGNSYSSEVSTGNYDAMQGLVLLGDGKGNFQVETSAHSGFNADGDSKGMAEICMNEHSGKMLVANNNGMMTSFQYHFPNSLNLTQNDAYAIIQKKDGTKYKEELFLGNTYLSSSSRRLSFSDSVTNITVIDYLGKKREIAFHSN